MRLSKGRIACRRTEHFSRGFVFLSLLQSETDSPRTMPLDWPDNVIPVWCKNLTERSNRMTKVPFGHLSAPLSQQQKHQGQLARGSNWCSLDWNLYSVSCWAECFYSSNCDHTCVWVQWCVSEISRLKMAVSFLFCVSKSCHGVKEFTLRLCQFVFKLFMFHWILFCSGETEEIVWVISVS